MAKAQVKLKGLYKSGAVRRFRTTTPSDLPGTPLKKRQEGGAAQASLAQGPALHKEQPQSRRSPWVS